MIDEFIFEPGRYIFGDITNVFEPKDIKKYVKAVPKSRKKICDYVDDLDFGYFKIAHKDTELVVQDCIEIDTLDVPSGLLVIVPEYVIGKRRLKSCRRFESKSEFNLKHICENDTAIICKCNNEPGPFIMFVTPFKTEQK